MKLELVCTLVLIFVLLIVLLRIGFDLRLKKRFGKHRIVLNLVQELSKAMMKEITTTVVSDNVRFKVFRECVKVSDERIISKHCSVHFSHEHMCHLCTEREKRLMAYAIAEQLKKRMICESSSYDEIKSKKYHIKTKCEKVLTASQKCFWVYIYYAIPNESYIHPERW